MNEDGLNKPPKKPEDFVDWEKLRQTDEYRKHMVSRLRIELENILLPVDFEEKRIDAFSDIGDIDDFDDIEDYIDARRAVDPATEEELKTLDEIVNLYTVEDVRKYYKLKNINLDIDEIIRKAEENYIRDEKLIAKMKDDLFSDPKIRDIFKFATGEEPKKEKPQ